MKISIDVIIPSYRPDEKFILPILQLSRPENSVVKFYLIIDNPAAILPPLLSRIDEKNIFIIKNEKNLGAAATRNKGITSGSGDWILFLDDDILVDQNLLINYIEAARKNPNEIGFIGLINFPKPGTSFTQAISISGSMDVFTIALRKTAFAWGATANIMVKRKAINGITFSTVYPNSGGGEDVDFFLNVRKKNNFKNFKTLKEASVNHPWWNYEKPEWRRPFRYGIGNSNLGYVNREYTYYDFLNTPETLLLSILAAIIAFILKSRSLVPLFTFITGVIIIEIIASAIQTIKRKNTVNFKVIFYVMALRLVHETGVLIGKISKLQLWRIGERFHDDGSINKVSFYRTNTYKLVKWILYPVLVFYIIRSAK
jgi:GT2 family glycosyltransferase